MRECAEEGCFCESGKGVETPCLAQGGDYHCFISCRHINKWHITPGAGPGYLEDERPFSQVLGQPELACNPLLRRFATPPPPPCIQNPSSSDIIWTAIPVTRDVHHRYCQAARGRKADCEAQEVDGGAEPPARTSPRDIWLPLACGPCWAA